MRKPARAPKVAIGKRSSVCLPLDAEHKEANKLYNKTMSKLGWEILWVVVEGPGGTIVEVQKPGFKREEWLITPDGMIYPMSAVRIIFDALCEEVP